MLVNINKLKNLDIYKEAFNLKNLYFLRLQAN